MASYELAIEFLDEHFPLVLADKLMRRHPERVGDVIQSAHRGEKQLRIKRTEFRSVKPSGPHCSRKPHSLRRVKDLLDGLGEAGEGTQRILKWKCARLENWVLILQSLDFEPVVQPDCWWGGEESAVRFHLVPKVWVRE